MIQNIDISPNNTDPISCGMTDNQSTHSSHEERLEKSSKDSGPTSVDKMTEISNSTEQLTKILSSEGSSGDHCSKESDSGGQSSPNHNMNITPNDTDNMNITPNDRICDNVSPHSEEQISDIMPQSHIQPQSLQNLQNQTQSLQSQNSRSQNLQSQNNSLQTPGPMILNISQSFEELQERLKAATGNPEFILNSLAKHANTNNNQVNIQNIQNIQTIQQNLQNQLYNNSSLQNLNQNLQNGNLKLQNGHLQISDLQKLSDLTNPTLQNTNNFQNNSLHTTLTLSNLQNSLNQSRKESDEISRGTSISTENNNNNTFTPNTTIFTPTSLNGNNPAPTHNPLQPVSLIPSQLAPLTSLKSECQVANATTASFQDEIRVIPNIPLEYLKTRFSTHANRDIECLQCQHVFKAGKYKVNNTKLRQHILSKHKDDLNSWLTSNGNLFLPQIRLELYERPWRCTQCTKCYKLKHHLKQHMETAHGVSPSQANRVTIKNENSELDSPSMNEGVKQFLKMTKDNNSGATTPLSGTLEALVHSAFGNGNHSMENGLHSPKMNNHLHNQSNPSSPRNCDENGEPRSKMPKLDSELMSIFTNSGVNSSALANQISSSLGLKVNIQDDDQNSEDGENNPMEMLQTAEEYANNVKQEALDMEMSGMNGLNENESHNHSQNGTIDIPTTLANLQSTPVSSLNSNFITTRIIPVTQASPKSSTKFNIAAIAQAAVKNAQKESVSTKEKNFKTNSAGVKGQYTCKYCSISFPDNILYGLHMGQHCVSEPFKCNICSYNCTDRYDFMFHFAMGRHEK